MTCLKYTIHNKIGNLVYVTCFNEQNEPIFDGL